ncbi:hypothetical protein N8072_01660 [bacterium]|nr:hypothetical protein [bacterium]MDB4128551.1 hypothetical protein [bacterium]MDC1257361.1 hypothetical protein [bacterium]
MAYVSQEMKKALTPAIKAVLKKHRVKATISVDNHSTLCVNIKEGAIDFIGEQNKNNMETCRQRGTPFYESDGYIQVNEYYPETYGDGADFLVELVAAMKGPDYFNNDDSMTDYFHRSHYTNINVGKWNKPYVYSAFVGL